MMSTIETAAQWMWRASWQGAVLIGVVLVLRVMLGKRISPAWWCAMWMVVGVRLVVPGVGVPLWEIDTRAVAAKPVAIPAMNVVVERGSLIGGAMPEPV